MRPLIVAAAAVMLVSCTAPMPAADDEGHATFAREAIKVLLGRPARGSNEVEVVADIAKLSGRAVAVEMLMQDKQFIDTWADVMVEVLDVQREELSQLAAQDGSCWGAPLRTDPDPAIALWVRANGPQVNVAAMPQNWNMSDLLRSAILIDDLSPVYTAYLFTLSMRRAMVEPEWEEYVRRDEIASRIMRVYLNRDPTCLGCHNPIYSASNKTSPPPDSKSWQRLWAIAGHPEHALFGNYYDPEAVRERLRPILRGDVRQGATGGFGIRPWGMAESCATDTQDGSALNTPNPNPILRPLLTNKGFRILPPPAFANGGGYPGAAFGSLNKPPGPFSPKLSVWELEGALRAGIDGLRGGYSRSFSPPTVPANLLQYCEVDRLFSLHGCKSCHSNSNPEKGLNLATNDPATQLIGINNRVVVGDAAASKLASYVASGFMPIDLDPLSQGEVTTIKQWIDSGAPHAPIAVCVTDGLKVDPDEAFAFLTASNLVDGIWAAVMGHRLTIAHGYSRTAEQRDMLGALTESEFLPHGWSLRKVLIKILASEWFARRAPNISQASTAYMLPPILDPWVLADPTVVSNPAPHQQYNGEGELVERFRVNALLRNIAASLGWKPPKRFPATADSILNPDNTYPWALGRNLGQYLSPRNPGFKGFNFQSLLALESEVGLCNKGSRAAGTTDWIDNLVTEIGVFNAKPVNAGAPITLGEAWMMLKDRLIQDPTIHTALPLGLPSSAKTEQQALANLFGVSLNTTASTTLVPTLVDKLRAGCGVIVKSPQFVLTNITPRSYSDNNMPGPMRLDVCLAGEPCGYAPICGYWTQKLFAMGQNVVCQVQDRSVRKGSGIPVIDPDWHAFTVAGSDPSSPRQVWAVLTRQTEPSAQINLSAAKSGAAPKQVAASATPTPPPAPSSPSPQFDLIKSVRESPRPLRGLSRVNQRFATLCPGSLCGFVERPASVIARCLEAPNDKSCRALYPLCDPRITSGPYSCGTLPADLRASGVLVAWAEGAEVTDTANALLLSIGDKSWQPLRAGAKLAAGDLIRLPFTASLRLQAGNVAFGDTSMAEEKVAGLSGHLLAITGPSAEKLLEQRPAPGTLSPAELIRGVQSGAYESRAMTANELKQATAMNARREIGPRLAPAQIKSMNSNFEALHHGVPKERLKLK
jgi:hypothetical protein